MGRPGTRALIGGVVVAAVIAVVAVVYSQQAKGKPDLPESACWGALQAADLRPLVSGSGRATASQQTPLRFTATDIGRDCIVSWSGSKFSLLQADVNADTGSAFRRDRGGAAHAQDLHFGTGVPGFSEASGSVEVSFPCAWPGSASSPYKHVQLIVYGTPEAGAGSKKAQQAYVDIAYKIARAAVRQLPCGNTVHFAAAPPTL